jgi:hypothetical protein
VNSFDDYFNIEKTAISKLCMWFNKHSCYRIEYEDLFSEASLKLFELYQRGKTDKNYTLTSIKNHLARYVSKNSLGQEVAVGLNPQEFL